MSVDRHEAMRLQLEGYRLATAEILYRLPDHPQILQSYSTGRNWTSPHGIPKLRRFLQFLAPRNLHGRGGTRRAPLPPA